MAKLKLYMEQTKKCSSTKCALFVDNLLSEICLIKKTNVSLQLIMNIEAVRVPILNGFFDLRLCPLLFKKNKHPLKIQDHFVKLSYQVLTNVPVNGFRLFDLIPD